MGYRSSVDFQVPVAEWDNFRAALQDESVVLHKVPLAEIDEFLDDLRQHQFPDRYIFFHDYIKWYEAEDHVIGCVKAALDNLSEHTFYRVGEDSEDSEIYDFCHDADDEWIHCRDVSCSGTNDALAKALSFLGGMESAPSAVRQEAIAKLGDVLSKLIKAEINVCAPDSGRMND